MARFAGIRDRDAAERLRNVKLYVPRERLPAPEQTDEFYHADLIGLTVGRRAGASSAPWWRCTISAPAI